MELKLDAFQPRCHRPAEGLWSHRANEREVVIGMGVERLCRPGLAELSGTELAQRLVQVVARQATPVSDGGDHRL